MADKPNVIRDTDDEARLLARTLLRSARYGAIAVLEPENGFPFASRVLVGTDFDGVPVILVSGLSTHTTALAKDNRTSVLFGEPGKGDPLAYPRLTVQCLAERVGRDNDRHGKIRWRFLSRHPKAQLYVDFPDFTFFRLVPQSASLNGGFGKAYILDGEELVIASPASQDIADIEPSAIAHMNSDLADAIQFYARELAGKKDGEWTMCGIDAAGVDIQCGDRLARIEFDSVVTDAADLRKVLAGLRNRGGQA